MSSKYRDGYDPPPREVMQDDVTLGGPTTVLDFEALGFIADYPVEGLDSLFVRNTGSASIFLHLEDPSGFGKPGLELAPDESFPIRLDQPVFGVAGTPGETFHYIALKRLTRYRRA